MNNVSKKINIDKEVVKLLYGKYKNYLLPIATILFCILLFIYAIIPQIQNIQTLQNQEREEAKRLEILRSNLNLLYNLDSKTLDNQLRLVSKALPTEKDFIGILNGIAIATQKANVSLGDYGFQVGDIGKTSTSVRSTPSLELTLTVNGNLSNLVNFIKELKNTVPLSEVKTIGLTNNSSTITTVFYYKPLLPVRIKDDVSLKPFSPSVLTLINNLSKMNNAQLESEKGMPSASNSSPSAVFFGM